MSIFQNSVVTKQLQSQDKTKLVAQWNVFTTHFHNPAIQDNIRSSKEEQYQGEFLIDLFVNVLGYTKNPTPNFSITTEYKNVKDSKKADGAILINDKVKAVIELKGTNTTDLNKIEVQAFGYKNNQPDCVYVITSNFEKLRFYIDNATEHLEFNLFNLTEKEFQLLYLCLAYENIANDVPKKLKEQSLSKEKDITKALYTDYSLFKRELHQDLVKQNPDFDALELFKKSQKLLDRFLFLFFAEDRQLLPPNSVRLILDDWRDLQDRDEDVRLYNRFKKYFEYLNTGFKGKRYDVFAYNGGLFKPDELLDNIIIDDELLFKHTLKLSDYDFASEVDVNILGHIFENSLNELDEIKAQLEGGIVEKTTTKRKKDGVFYTPKYITKYIVDNTVGKLCMDKKAELKIIEEDYYTDKKRNKATKQPLLEKLTIYRNWLLQLTICDPACGSGAFLNQALDFLISEHKYIDELQAKLFGDALVLSDVEKSILENNLYGVDLNEESVEIAKLSLWLRTAQPNRKLNNLNDNIKCGNSLIDDVAIAGEKAFNWQTAFPKIFDKGGFDVIIGNPPYGAKISKIELNNIINKFDDFGISTNLSDTYFSFYALCLKTLLAENGYLGFITPNTWRLIESAKKFRKTITEKPFCISQIIQHNEKVFSDATVDCDTLIIKKDNTISNILISITNENGVFLQHLISQSILSNQDSYNLFLTKIHYDLKDKINQKSTLIKDEFIIKNGVKPYEKGKGKPAQTAQILLEKPYTSLTKTDDSFSPLIGGSSFHRYNLFNENINWIQYGEWLAAPREKSIFENKEKLIFRQTSDSIIGSLVSDGYIIRNNTHIILNKEDSKFSLKYIITILNSKLVNWYYWTINPEKGEAMAEVKAFHLGMLPFIYFSNENQQPFIEKADLMLSLNEDLQEQSQKFQRTLQRKFELESLPKKLQDWYLLNYPDFIKELTKLKIKLTLSQEAEWEEYFIAEATKVMHIRYNILTTDEAIDKMVYELYGLSKEEIEIVEKS
jgi:type I restriction-modification system DNA methylase subunit